MTSSVPEYCGQCDYARHICPGCGADIKHGQACCSACAQPDNAKPTLRLLRYQSDEPDVDLADQYGLMEDRWA